MSLLLRSSQSLFFALNLEHPGTDTATDPDQVASSMFDLAGAYGKLQSREHVVDRFRVNMLHKLTPETETFMIIGCFQDQLNQIKPDGSMSFSGFFGFDKGSEPALPQLILWVLLLGSEAITYGSGAGSSASNRSTGPGSGLFLSELELKITSGFCSSMEDG